MDVTAGAKFYGPGKTYAQFAGTVRLTDRLLADDQFIHADSHALCSDWLQACTRALTLGSLEKKVRQLRCSTDKLDRQQLMPGVWCFVGLDLQDISDDVSDFDEKQHKEMLETLEFYYDKYPIVRLRRAAPIAPLSCLTRSVRFGAATGRCARVTWRHPTRRVRMSL